MAMVVWVMMGIAIWHFAVFVPDHFWGGIVGAFGAAAIGAVVVGLALAGGAVAGVEVVPNRFDPKVFPIGAVQRARAERLEGKLFNNFIWGGYLLHQWPEQPVFIDGGTDHYGEKLFGEYIQVWNLDPGWRDVLERRGIDLMLIPPQSRLADELIRDQGWAAWYCDSTAAILRKPGKRPGPEGTPQAAPCPPSAGASR